MSTFLLLLFKLIPFYGIAFLGFALAKTLNISIKRVGSIYLFVLLPPVVFYGMLQVPLLSGEILAPLLYFSIAAAMSFTFLHVGRRFLSRGMAYLLAFTTSVNNIGYIGIPLAVALFGQAAVGPAALTIVGSQLYFNSFGYYLASRGNYTAKQALMRTIKLPTLYAFILGAGIQLLNIDISGTLLTTALSHYVKIYNILGLLLVGIGFASITRESLDKRYLLLSLFASIILWPLIVGLIMYVDLHTTQIFSELGRRVLFLQSLAPIGINVITVASVVKLYPEKAALAVTVCTLLSIVYIPIALSLFLNVL